MLAWMRSFIVPTAEARHELEAMQRDCLASVRAQSVAAIRDLAPGVGAYAIPGMGQEKRVGRWTLETAAFVWRGESLFVHAQAWAKGGMLPGRMTLAARVLEIDDSGTVRELDNHEAEARSAPTW